MQSTQPYMHAYRSGLGRTLCNIIYKTIPIMSKHLATVARKKAKTSCFDRLSLEKERKNGQREGEQEERNRFLFKNFFLYQSQSLFIYYFFIYITCLLYPHILTYFFFYKNSIFFRDVLVGQLGS